MGWPGELLFWNTWINLEHDVKSWKCMRNNIYRKYGNQGLYIYWKYFMKPMELNDRFIFDRIKMSITKDSTRDTQNKLIYRLIRKISDLWWEQQKRHFIGWFKNIIWSRSDQNRCPKMYHMEIIYHRKIWYLVNFWHISDHKISQNLPKCNVCEKTGKYESSENVNINAK